jgi:D-alanyl-lipoteichoic acid acyltransferase DltB (MBOAT superfamily)
VQPENFRFGGGSTAMILHPIVLVAMIIVIVLIFLLPRKFLVVPLLLSMFLIPLGQRFVVSGFHLFVLRIIVLCGLIRMLFSKRSPDANLKRFFCA